eukprot:8834078-Pyramimonas_sp.AAC.1
MFSQQQRRRDGLRGTTVPDVHGISGERHEPGLAAQSGTMINGMLNIILGVGSNIHIIGLKAAQTFEQ